MIRPRNMWILFHVLLLWIYLALYVAFFHMRVPSGNMRYFLYFENPSADDITYHIFWPAYKAHEYSTLVLRKPFAKHNKEREPFSSDNFGP